MSEGDSGGYTGGSGGTGLRARWRWGSNWPTAIPIYYISWVEGRGISGSVSI